MQIARIAAAAPPALLFAFFGVQKFGGENAVFQFMAERSGLAFFEPGVRMLTGAAELATAGLILAGLVAAPLRGLGGLLGLAVVGGAIVFHLTPWLGVNAPVGFDPSGAYVRSPFLFVTALVLAGLTALHVFVEKPAILTRGR